MLCEKEMVQKRCFYEYSARIPFIVRIPDRSRAGSTVAAPVSLIDLLPTFCDLAGVNDRAPCDGESIAPLLEGDRGENRVIFSEMHSEAVAAPCFMVRRGAHKYIHIHGHDEQLFDLSQDPGEWHNIAKDPSAAPIRDALRQLILDRFDPDAIADDVLQSLYRRRVIKASMASSGTSWAHTPVFDPKRNAVSQYYPQ